MIGWRADRIDIDRERLELRGLADPDLTELEIANDERLDEQDRTAELAGLAFYGVQVDRPSERERRAHFDERRARNTLRPRTGNVQVQPRCECGARETGHKHPGHLYRCPSYARRDQKPAA